MGTLESTSILAQTDTAVIIALPEIAEVALKSGGAYSGRVANINTQTQELVLQRGNDRRKVSLREIDRVEFDLESPYHRTSGTQPLVIRGDGSLPSGDQERWEIALSDFRFKDITLGHVEVLGLPRGVRAVARKATYVVDEIRFDLTQEMITVLATPYTPEN